MLCISFSILGAFYNSQIIDHVSFPHTMLLRKYGKKINVETLMEISVFGYHPLEHFLFFSQNVFLYKCVRRENYSIDSHQIH